ncbi:hypothetical protein [Rugamonas aquatica]|uniref:Uncharacterized protein n=1 Tax=Rugamonas aquatica TaxID=2743357 RepID=A0A6A7N7A4_9BURK|nr:hypothetical protein [Rugamonas aquatica]MQA40742.1 hypothetical protein [Rugamonas aquatica]
MNLFACFRSKKKTSSSPLVLEPTSSLNAAPVASKGSARAPTSASSDVKSSQHTSLLGRVKAAFSRSKPERVYEELAYFEELGRSLQRMSKAAACESVSIDDIFSRDIKKFEKRLDKLTREYKKLTRQKYSATNSTKKLQLKTELDATRKAFNDSLDAVVQYSTKTGAISIRKIREKARSEEVKRLSAHYQDLLYVVDDKHESGANRMAAFLEVITVQLDILKAVPDQVKYLAKNSALMDQLDKKLQMLIDIKIKDQDNGITAMVYEGLLPKFQNFEKIWETANRGGVKFWLNRVEECKDLRVQWGRLLKAVKALKQEYDDTSYKLEGRAGKQRQQLFAKIINAVEVVHKKNDPDEGAVVIDDCSAVTDLLTEMRGRWGEVNPGEIFAEYK